MLSAIGRVAVRHAGVGAINLPIRGVGGLAVPLTCRAAVVFSLGGSGIAARFARGFAAEAGSTKTKTKTAAKANTATKTKAKAEKKPAAAKKKTAKAAAKSKATGENKKRGAAKKTLTDEEKTKLKVKELKKKALAGKEPDRLPDQAWMVYLKKRMPELLGPDSKVTFRDAMNELSKEYKALSESEKQKLETEAQKNKVTNEANLKSWIEEHTAQEIREANLARQLLRRKYGLNVGPTIQDPRFPKPAMNGYAAYVKSRYHAPEYEGVKPTEKLVKIGEEWRAMSPEQRKPYMDIGDTELQRHKKEMEEFRETASL
ncbi:hypothetical protein VTH06DRAFT_2625 [Thermothelomyces fergusii]